MNRLITLPILAATLISTPPLVLAQSADSNLTLDEVVVTATKRESTEFDAPLSLEVVTGDQIAEARMVDLGDVAAMIPNLSLGEGQTAQSIFMRGIGSGSDRSFEQSVSLFVDDVYAARSRQYRSAFFDMERLEVIRGPQAVLYGLNATAGTLNIISAKTRPGDETHFDLKASYETEYEGTQLEAVVGGSPNDSVGLRLAARVTDTGDGVYFNEYTGQDEGGTEETLIRGTAIFEPSDALTLTFKIDYAESDYEGNQGELFASPLDGVLPGVNSGLNWVRNTEVDLMQFLDSKPAGFYTESLTTMANIEYALENHTLTGIVSYTDFEIENLVEVAGLPFQAFVGRNLETYEQTSGEIRLTSTGDQSFDYILGLYVSDGDMVNDFPTAIGPLLAGAGTLLAQNIFNKQGSQLVSPFAQVTFSVSDNLKLIAGARYSSEDKDAFRAVGSLLPEGCGIYTDADGDGFDYALAVPLPDPACVTFPDESFSRSSNNFMPELVAQWDVGENTMIYGKAANSVKSGGFATSGSIGALDVVEYRDEEATTIELGLKTRFMDGRGSLNLAVFHTQIDDLQVNTFQLADDGVTILTVINNAAESTSEGLEAELNFVVTDWLTVGGSIGFLNAEFDNFTSAPCAQGETPNGTVPGTCLRDGFDTPFSPENSGSLFANFDVPLSSNLVLSGGVTMGFSSDYFTDGSLEPTARQSSYQRWDARIGISDAEDKWGISLVGKNLNDEVILTNSVVIAGIGNMGYIQDPMTLALQGRISF